MTVFEPYVLWGEGTTVSFHTMSELEQLLDYLAQHDEGTPPVGIQIIRNEQSGLLITLGRELSHVEFFGANDSPQVIGCRGPWDTDTLIGFTFGGEYTEMEQRFFVPIDVARAAVREYVQTGTKPMNLLWDDDDIAH